MDERKSEIYHHQFKGKGLNFSQVNPNL